MSAIADIDKLDKPKKLIGQFASQSIGVGYFDTATYLRYKKDIAFCSSLENLNKIAKSMMEEICRS